MFGMNVSFRSKLYSALENKVIKIIVLIYLLKAYSPVNHTGSPQGFSQVQILRKLNTMQNMHIIQT